MNKIFYLLFVFPLFYSCGGEEISNEKSQVKSSKKNSEDVSINQILDALKLSDFEDSCFHNPLIIESPYQEIKTVTKGGMFFGGSDLTMNYQYSYYSNVQNQILDEKSWITETGIVSDIKFSTKKNKFGYEVPIIKGNWKHTKDANLKATFSIEPIIHGKNAGKIYYKLNGGRNWNIFGYKQKSKAEFDKISKDMCKLSNIKFTPVENKKDICTCLKLLPDVINSINSRSARINPDLTMFNGCLWLLESLDDFNGDDIEEVQKCKDSGKITENDIERLGLSLRKI